MNHLPGIGNNIEQLIDREERKIRSYKTAATVSITITTVLFIIKMAVS